jgi:hypothetical protein
MGISLKLLTHKPKQPPKDPGNAKQTPRVVVEDFEVENGVRTLKRINIISVSYGLDRNP